MTNTLPPAIFDRRRLRAHKERSHVGFADHAFLFDEVADRLDERLDDVVRRFSRVLDIGGRMIDRVRRRPGVEWVVSTEPSPSFARDAAGVALQADADALPFAKASFDLVVSNLSLHWADDLPGALLQIQRTLRPDGFFCAAMLGGTTLNELRRSLMDAELAILGGAAARVSPFAALRDMGDLLVRAGFTLPVADGESITVTYADPWALLRDLRGMGETAALAGSSRPLRRDVLFEAVRRYATVHAEPDGRIPATFDVIHLAGWAPDPSQPKPLRPGSADQRLADALKER